MIRSGTATVSPQHAADFGEDRGCGDGLCCAALDRRPAGLDFGAPGIFDVTLVGWLQRLDTRER